MYYTEYSKDQKALVHELKLHVFGSIENYNAFKESRDNFPTYYKDVKRIIENKSFSDDVIRTKIIPYCRKVEIITGTNFSLNTENTKGSRNNSCFKGEIKVDTMYSPDHVKGTCGRKTKQDPTERNTFTHCLGTYVSRRRKANWTEEALWKEIQLYVNAYNEKHNTSFTPYMPKRKNKKK